MTKFINAANIATAKQEKKETIFKKYLGAKGWEISQDKPEEYAKVVYLGKCCVDGDMFACTTNLGAIVIYKGTKGDEFND
jgi:hypothetical protein